MAVVDFGVNPLQRVVTFLSALLWFPLASKVVFSQEEQQILAAYLDVSHAPASNKYTFEDLSSKAALLTDLFLFAVGPDEQGNLVGYDDGIKTIFETARRLRKWKASQSTGQPLLPTLRLWITIGGGTKSEAFEKCTSSPSARQNLIQSVKKLW